MEKTPGITIIVPALNEEGNLEGTISSIHRALNKVKGTLGEDYEIIVFNDSSTDSTGEIADKLAKRDLRIRAVHNPRTMGFGYNYTEGVRLAAGKYVMMVPGDNEIPEKAIRTVLERVGSADIVIPYTANPWVRPMARRVISRVFVFILNTLFGLRLRYYNGTCVHRGELLKKVPMKSWDFAYMAAILVRLLKSGATYVEVGVEIELRREGSSKAFSPRNVLRMMKTVLTLFSDVYLRKNALLKNPSAQEGNEDTIRY